MQHWEYCEVRQDISSGILHKQYINFYRTNGQSEAVLISSREQAIAQLGLEGWEMVGTAGSFMSDGGGLLVFFKRPLVADDSGE